MKPIDLGNGYRVRQATAADHAAMSAVCLKTGDAGGDATAREDDPDLLGLIYAIPYQVLEPDLAFVVEGKSGVCGYVLGARDTRAFNAALEAVWYPQLRQRIGEPDPANPRGSDWARHLIHHPDLEFPAPLAPYPSHGHIDLLPEAQGKGIGRRAMALLEERLAAAGSSGLYMQLSPRNQGARKFYTAIGFSMLRSAALPQHSLFAVKSLQPMGGRGAQALP